LPSKATVRPISVYRDSYEFYGNRSCCPLCRPAASNRSQCCASAGATTRNCRSSTCSNRRRANPGFHRSHPQRRCAPGQHPVVVHDKKGALVQNLAKDNFALQIDGKPQSIRYFNLDTDLPLTLGLLVDVSLSQRDAIDEERTASFAFLDDTISSRDKAFIVQFARQTDLLQDVTGSKPRLQAGLKQLETPASGGDADNTSSSSGSNSGDSSTRTRRAGTTLYDALFLASDELMAKQTGRKAIVILSDGVDSGSKESLASSIEAASAPTPSSTPSTSRPRNLRRINQNQGRQVGEAFPVAVEGGGGYPGGGGGYPVAERRRWSGPSA